MAQLGKANGFAHLQRNRLLRWKDMVPNRNATNSSNPRAAIQLIAEMTDPKKDLVNLRAVPPQLNHRRAAQNQNVKPIIRKSRSQIDISNLYPSMYAKQSLANQNSSSKSQLNSS